MLDALKAKEIPPRWVVGTGYKDPRKVAIDYLTERLENEREKESCYGCDQFYPKAELVAGQIDGYAVKVCEDCGEKL